ncbi:MAG: DUF998 domain-containing protein [Umezawaea sp.]
MNLHRLRWAGLVAVLTGVQYLVLEAVAAAAWHDPPYRYAVNYISDLGAAGSPLAWVMNTAFVVQGMGFLVLGLAIAAQLRGPRRFLVAGLAVAHAVGNVLVAAFPSSTGSGFHLAGAVLAIGGGNLAALFVGLRGLPVLGLVSVLLLGRIGAGEIDGLWERGGVYSITAWEIVFGVVLLVRSRLGESTVL